MKIQTKNGAVIATGQLRQNDPVEYRKVGQNETPLATFGIIIDRHKNPDGSKTPEWLNCKAWRNLAQKAAVCPGGADILVAGHMEDETWTGRDGQIHSRQVCVCEFIATATFTEATPYEAPKPQDVMFSELDDSDGELPF